MSSSAITVLELFEGRSYHLDSFQRTYAWGLPQIDQLIDDLAHRFQRQWDETHTEDDVRYYDPYFLGSIITYRRGDQTYLADGQQRIVTLLLVLIHLFDLTADREDAQDLHARVRTLIRGDSRARRRFAVRIDAYESYFDQLFTDRPTSADGESPDVLRMQEASKHLLARWPDRLKQDVLVLFGWWLLDRVSLVELDAGDAERGEEMFVAMNDRGLRLAPLDLLKRYLLTGTHADRGKLDRRWKAMVNRLDGLGQDAPLEFVRTVLRAHFFDVDPTGRSDEARENAPHEWLHRHADSIWPSKRRDRQLALFTDYLEPLHEPYVTLLAAADDFTPGLDGVWFNALNRLPRQFDLTLAAADRADSSPTVQRKGELVANFLDLYFVTHTLRQADSEPEELDTLVAELRPAVRESRTADELGRILGRVAAGWYRHFSEVPQLRYRPGTNRPFVVYLLARLTSWLEKGSGKDDPIVRLLSVPSGRRPYEVEHLFTRKSGTYSGQAASDADFQKVRGLVGGLVLLDGAENASVNSAPLESKMPTYLRANWLAASLDASTLSGRGIVNFREFTKKHGLNSRFRAYEADDPVEAYVQSRGQLYQAMAERIWSPDALGLPLPSTAAGAPASAADAGRTGGARPRRRNHGVRLSDLLSAGLVRPNEKLIGRWRGTEHRATLLADGRIRTESGGRFGSPSAAAKDATDANPGAWNFWKVDETNASLDAVRAQYLRIHGGAGSRPTAD
ncbi:DUF262 domain-containing protein [Frankia sp. Cpl3]|uniref:restriction system modified-DNA reader domain-containing protein n=1 Tax=Parafrankia colletiae TaxID=573497 RepID=UPI0012FF7965|nr:DUF262 domain-containing protein [Parafrankia colletiae]MCK9904305.1 DUF262 domain-containing protein [Frankia sp. Cpl3]